MSGRNLSSGARTVVVILALAVLLCLSLGAGVAMGDMGHAVLFCCFVLAVVLLFGFVARPPSPISHTPPVMRRAPPRGLSLLYPRPPDRIALGSLLI